MGRSDVAGVEGCRKARVRLCACVFHPAWRHKRRKLREKNNKKPEKGAQFQQFFSEKPVGVYPGFLKVPIVVFPGFLKVPIVVTGRGNVMGAGTREVGT